ncbi:MAG: hypothetical protein AAGA54_36595 [Myxococcota bacterium]
MHLRIASFVVSVFVFSIAVGCEAVVDDDAGETEAGDAGETEAGDAGTTADTNGGGDTGASGGVFPGQPGGQCLAPDGSCSDAGILCNLEKNFCFDPEEPCRGFTCGGADRGTCMPEGGLPSCVCAAGFENDTFELYCCPTDGSDPVCL